VVIHEQAHCLDQRSVYAEVLLRQKVSTPGLAEDPGKKPLSSQSGGEFQHPCQALNPHGLVSGRRVCREEFSRWPENMGI